MQELFGDPISVYTRAQAIEDGVLIEVNRTAREARIKFPVAVTARVWHDYIVPDDRSRPYGQSEAGRLWDAMYLLSNAARRSQEREIRYTVRFIMKERQPRDIQLKALCGPGDDGRPVITVMIPDED